MGCGVESVKQGQNSNTVALTLSGLIQNASGAKLSGVAVTCLESGDSKTSDAAGSFALNLSLDETTTTISFLLESDTVNTVSNSVQIPGSGATILITVSQDGSSALVEVSQSTTKPTPPAGSVFDADGNTISFGIPVGLVGNVHQGKRLYVQECASCHANLAGGNESFPQLKRTIAGSPMFITLPDSTLADIVAYLQFKSQ